MAWLDLLAVQGTLKSLLQHHSSKASILQCSAFFIVQLSHPYMTTGKTIALTRWTFVGKVISLLFNMLSRLVITLLPRSKRLNFTAAVTICSDFRSQKSKVSLCFCIHYYNINYMLLVSRSCETLESGFHFVCIFLALALGTQSEDSVCSIEYIWICDARWTSFCERLVHSEPSWPPLPWQGLHNSTGPCEHTQTATQPQETARACSLSACAHEAHEGVPTPRDQARVRNQRLGSVCQWLLSSSPTPDGDQGPSSLLCLMSLLPFPQHGMAVAYSHTCIFLCDFVEGALAGPQRMSMFPGSWANTITSSPSSWPTLSSHAETRSEGLRTDLGTLGEMTSKGRRSCFWNVGVAGGVAEGGGQGKAERDLQ